MLGGSIPYGKLWRTGANEPTIFYAPVPLRVAGLNVPPGVYSLYTVPGPKEWEVIVNRSTSQWGHEGQYTDEVKAQELGRAKVKSEPLKPRSRLSLSRPSRQVTRQRCCSTGRRLGCGFRFRRGVEHVIVEDL